MTHIHPRTHTDTHTQIHTQTHCFEGKHFYALEQLSLVNPLHVVYCFVVTDCILLRYCLSGKPPRIKQLSWPPERVIVCMCFDPTVTWLLILTSKPEIFIIPAFSLMVRFKYCSHVPYCLLS